MTRNHRSALVLILSMVAAAVALDAADAVVKTDYDRSVAFDALRSYAWLPTPPDAKPAKRIGDPRFEQEALDGPIRAAVERALTSKRMTATTGEPDFYVVYYAAFGFGLDPSVVGSYYSYSTGLGSPLTGSTALNSLRVIQDGTLIVDILQRDKTKAIWRGTATGTVDPAKSDEERRRTIDKAVQKMFDAFPPRGR